MEYLYDMGFLINRSMHRVLKNELYIYNPEVRQLTIDELLGESMTEEEAANCQ